jgi:hypothetical protein
MEQEHYAIPQIPGYTFRDISSAYVIGGSSFPSYMQLQSRNTRPARDYSVQM